VWRDANSDGVSQAGELHSLTDLGITSLDVKAQATSVNSNGNWVGLTSSYATADGTTKAMADVWFLIDPASAASDAAQPTDLRGQVGELVQTISEFESAQAAPVAPAAGGLGQAVPTAGVAGSVGGIVNALRTFDPNATTSYPLTVGGVPIAESLTSGLITKPNPANGGILGSGNQ
jgi:hypothetical protein